MKIPCWSSGDFFYLSNGSLALQVEESKGIRNFIWSFTVYENYIVCSHFPYTYCWVPEK
jgi:hypothetical protein